MVLNIALKNGQVILHLSTKSSSAQQKRTSASSSKCGPSEEPSKCLYRGLIHFPLLEEKHNIFVFSKGSTFSAVLASWTRGRSPGVLPVKSLNYQPVWAGNPSARLTGCDMSHEKSTTVQNAIASFFPAFQTFAKAGKKQALAVRSSAFLCDTPQPIRCTLALPARKGW